MIVLFTVFLQMPLLLNCLLEKRRVKTLFLMVINNPYWRFHDLTGIKVIQ